MNESRLLTGDTLQKNDNSDWLKRRRGSEFSALFPI